MRTTVMRRQENVSVPVEFRAVPSLEGIGLEVEDVLWRRMNKIAIPMIRVDVPVLVNQVRST